MNVLVVYAHPEPKSFNGAMRDLAVRVLGGMGHDVNVSDLYALDFKATADAEDFGTLANPDFFKVQAEQSAAAARGMDFAPDIRHQLDLLLAADLLILQFPLWWFGLPAILKGWVDRVFAAGVTYGGDVGWFSKGRFRGRRAMVAMTTGGGADSFAADGLSGALDVVLWPIQNGMLNFVGFDVLPPYIAYSPARVDAAARAALLADYEARLRAVETTPPLRFHPLEDFDGRRLKPGVAPLTVGQGLPPRGS
ncbi:MAG: NAD(P)H-dependent oxidoreductase [Hyphomicrobiales bacterium]|nr:NAD(P)H-dependent oxidoreductase [Hyphomicrobiales bacterium]MCP5373365.1 NAD(P)H-dependent oxidoreductase [Hyphomicrobiales bacterium]